MSIQELVGKLKREIMLPQIDPEKCVHSLIEQASCEACVEACPRGAWLLDDDALGIDTEVCDGCGICVPACPQGAIASDIKPQEYDYKGQRLALVACERADVNGDGVVPCLHAVSLSDFLRLYERGVRRLFYARGDCSGCDRRGSRSFDGLQENVRCLLESHALMPFSVHEYQPQEWRVRRDFLAQASGGELVSRRGFMREMVGEVLEQRQMALPGGDLAERNIAPSELIPEDAIGGIFPHAPHIDSLQCIACDACANLCFQKAIRLDKQSPSYVVDPGYCNGCGLCVDVCEVQAVSVTDWVSSKRQTIELLTGKCEACGAPFHYPEAQQTDRSLCRICATGGRQKAPLFQVLES